VNNGFSWVGGRAPLPSSIFGPLESQVGCIIVEMEKEKNPIIGPILISEVIGLKKNSFLTTTSIAYVGPHTSAKLE